jgi:hypothetical protein
MPRVPAYPLPLAEFLIPDCRRDRGGRWEGRPGRGRMMMK